MSKVKGIVLFYNCEKGWGYIQYVENNDVKKIFVHHTGLKGRKQLSKHQYVSFVIGQNERGTIAQEVEVVNIAKATRNIRTDGTAAV